MKLVIVAGVALALAVTLIVLGRSSEKYKDTAWSKFNDISADPWL